jgi:hypothetical protein
LALIQTVEPRIKRMTRSKVIAAREIAGEKSSRFLATKFHYPEIDWYPVYRANSSSNFRPRHFRVRVIGFEKVKKRRIQNAVTSEAAREVLPGYDARHDRRVCDQSQLKKRV